jgi:hypothetical protein
MANVEKCEEVLQFIKDHPEKHDQGTWGHETDCGTAACFAGWAVLLNGYELQLQFGDPFGGHCFDVKSLKTGVRSAVATAAAEVLELTYGEAMTLFHAGNTFEELEQMVKNISNGDPIERNTRHDEED